LIRAIGPVRRRIKRIAGLADQGAKIVNRDRVPEQLAFQQINQRSDFLARLPDIAQCFRTFGMRPGEWVAPEVTKKFQKQGFSIVANTFYAVTPDLNELTDKDWRGGKYAQAWKTANIAPSNAALKKVEHYSKELKHVPLRQAAAQGQFYWSNPMFSPLDAVAYYSLIREVKPCRILEVGSGYSTAVAIMAAQQSPHPPEISCIEPYPSDFLLNNERKLSSLIKRKVQDVDPALFESLEPGDILFIDSSHCSHLNSDLNFLLFEAIPRVKAGVYIHFHDIFLPSEYPRQWLEEIGIMWNEQYLILAFLMFNQSFKMIWSSSVTGAEKSKELYEIFQPLVPDHTAFLQNLGPYSGGSLWLHKSKVSRL
jgi:hypothetical protein